MTDSTTAAKPSAASDPTLIHRIESVVDFLAPEKMFPVLQPLELELGSGDGSFLANYAKKHPERNFIGVERLLGRLRKLDKKGRRAGLKNMRLLRMEAAYLVEFMVAKTSLQALHVYFPDPWPKRKHRKNRLINERFTELSREVLLMGGIVYLRTDDADYYAQMTEVYGANKAFEIVETPAELSEVVTDFERNFHLRGVPTLAAAYRKTA